jgi:hypothetical protein
LRQVKDDGQSRSYPFAPPKYDKSLVTDAERFTLAMRQFAGTYFNLRDKDDRCARYRKGRRKRKSLLVLVGSLWFTQESTARSAFLLRLLLPRKLHLSERKKKAGEIALTRPTQELKDSVHRFSEYRGRKR